MVVLDSELFCVLLLTIYQFVDELQSQLIETEKERTAVCAAKKGLAEDLRASQQVISCVSVR